MEEAKNELTFLGKPKLLYFPAYIIIFGDRLVQLATLILTVASNIIKTHVMIFIGITAIVDILRRRHKSAIVTSICDAPSV